MTAAVPNSRRAALLVLVLQLCSSLVVGFMSASSGLATARRHTVTLSGQAHGAAAAAATTMLAPPARRPSTAAATKPATAARRSSELANGGFNSVARSESSTLLEELGRRDVFGVPPPGGPSNRDPNFEPNLGKVIDTLRNDYPLLFYEPLDYSIYVKDIVVKDPTGVVFKGLGTYRRLFAALRFFRSTLMDNVETRFRVVYDWANQRVRVNWHTTIVFKARRQHPVFVDCISVYKINDQGFVSQHNFETIIVNGTPVEPPFAYAWINLDPFLAGERAGARGGIAVPHGYNLATSSATSSGSSSDSAQSVWSSSTSMSSSSAAAAAAPKQSITSSDVTPTVLTAAAAAPFTTSTAAASPRAPVQVDLIKNLSSSSMTAAISESSARSRSSSSAAASKNDNPKENSNKKKKPKAGFAWPKIDLPEGCEDSWDCPSSQSCCDFVLFKACCSQGMGSPIVEPKLVPIPIPVEDYPQYPQYPPRNW